MLNVLSYGFDISFKVFLQRLYLIQEPMKIGNCVVEIYIPNTSTLKEKRSVIKGLKDRIHNKFNVSISEIDKNDNHKHSTIAFVTVSNSSRYTDKILAQVIKFMEKQKQFEIISYNTEIF